MLDKYIKYIKSLEKELKGYFDDQAEFLSCKAGCEICCIESYYPASELEYEYIKLGLQTLPEEIKLIITKRAFNIFIDRMELIGKNGENAPFNYECPFLFNKSCIIYEYRPILCRSYGLMFIDHNDRNKYTLPNCINFGLNYANVWDEKMNRISQEKADQLGINKKIQVYDIDYITLKKRASEIDFKEVHMLYEFIIFNTPNYKDIIKYIYNEQ